MKPVQFPEEELEVLDTYAEELNQFLDTYAEEDYVSITVEDIVMLLNSKFRKWGN